MTQGCGYVLTKEESTRWSGSVFHFAMKGKLNKNFLVSLIGKLCLYQMCFCFILLQLLRKETQIDPINTLRLSGASEPHRYVVWGYTPQLDIHLLISKQR